MKRMMLQGAAITLFATMLGTSGDASARPPTQPCTWAMNGQTSKVVTGTYTYEVYGCVGSPSYSFWELWERCQYNQTQRKYVCTSY